MRAAGRHRTRSARRGGGAALVALAVLLVLAPRAGGDAMPGDPAGASLGRDIEGLAFDADGRLYVADLRSDRVVVLGPAGETLGEIGAGALEEPTGVAIAPGGDVLVTDEHGVQRFGPDGTPFGAWAADEPAGIAIAADGTVYVSEEHGVTRFSGAGAPLGGWTADRPRGIAVAADGTVWLAVPDALAHFTAVGAPLGTTPAEHAHGVAAAPDGTVLVAERELDRVTRVAPDGTPAATIEDDFDEPRGVAVDCLGDVAVADDSPVRIHRIAAAGAPPPCVTGFPVDVAVTEPARPIARRLLASPGPAPAVRPSAGRSAFAATAFGRVLVRLPGARDLSDLRAGSLLPMGARIDARGGRVGLAFATRTGDFDRLGTVQSGDFESGLFSIHQPTGASLVELRLEGARPSCRLAATGHAVGARHLWSNVRGRFRTRGALATATATSARWLTEDRCDGTLVRVTRGIVRVRDRLRGRTVRVRAGERHLVRPRRRA
jgi:hypothetical protein